MKYKRHSNRIYTIMDFEDKEPIEYFGKPASASAYNKGYIMVRSIKDPSNIRMVHRDDIIYESDDKDKIPNMCERSEVPDKSPSDTEECCPVCNASNTRSVFKNPNNFLAESSYFCKKCGYTEDNDYGNKKTYIDMTAGLPEEIKERNIYILVNIDKIKCKGLPIKFKDVTIGPTDRYETEIVRSSDEYGFMITMVDHLVDLIKSIEYPPFGDFSNPMRFKVGDQLDEYALRLIASTILNNGWYNMGLLGKISGQVYKERIAEQSSNSSHTDGDPAWCCDYESGKIPSHMSNY